MRWLPVPDPSRAPPRSLTRTFAPSAAMASACSRPMPPPAPVTIATFPSSKPMGVSLAWRAHPSRRPIRGSTRLGEQDGAQAGEGLEAKLGIEAFARLVPLDHRELHMVGTG